MANNYNNGSGFVRRIFSDIFDAVFPGHDVEGIGMQHADLANSLSDMESGYGGIDASAGSGTGLSPMDLPSREISQIDAGYDSLSRRQRYQSYDQLEELIPEIHAGLNTYADEVSSYDDENHTLRIVCSNESVKEELEFLFFDPNMCDIDNRVWGWARNLCKYGDIFLELVIDPKSPHMGVLKLNELDASTMWRIQSRRGTLLEFQQALMGPDREAVVEDLRAKHSKDKNPNEHIFWKRRDKSEKPGVIRFAPAQVSHVMIGAGERGFKPYGMSILQAARRSAYNLRLMEDSMLLYRLCLVGNTRIRTDKSWKPIKDIKVGDIVFTYSEGGVVKESKVVNQVCNGNKPTLRVRSRHTELIGTATHPVLVKDGDVLRYVDMQDLKIKHHKLINVKRDSGLDVPIPRFVDKVAKLSEKMQADFKTLPYSKSPIIRELSEQLGIPENRITQFLYAKGKCLDENIARSICDRFNIASEDMVFCNKGEVNLERINLPEFIDEDFARLIGFLIGDGTVGKNFVSFCGKIENEDSKRYHELLKKYFMVTRIDEDKRTQTPVAHFRTNTTEAANIFRRLGLKVGPKNKRVPDWAFNAKPEIRKAIVEGFSNADGCEKKTKTGTWFSTLVSCNKDLLEDMKELWSSIGLSSGHIRELNVKERKIGDRTINQSTVYHLTITKIELPEFENVISVEKADDQLVYDITVEDEPHNFIANGVPVHNTRGVERRVYYVDVGGMAGPKIDTYLEEFKGRTKRKRVYNAKTQQVDERYNPWPVRRTTPIPLVDGRTLTIEEIAREWEDEKENWVYSILDKTLGTIVPGKIVWCGKNYHCSNMIRVWSDNNGYADVAPEHPFVLRDGSSKRADELRVGDSLMSLRINGFEKKSIENNSYTLMKEYALSNTAPLNHQVTKIEHLTGESDDVYCMTVVGPNGEKDRHNFALKNIGSSKESFVFVKNSVDDDLYLPMRQNSTTRIDTLPAACLALDTKIPLIDGRTLSLSDIIVEYVSGAELWAYSCDPSDGRQVPGKITWAGVTRLQTDVVRVTLGNGKIITCTPDHKFPVIEKGDVEAKDLISGTALIPFKNLDQDEVIESDNKVVSVEFLSDKIDTGTLTIDGREKLHGFHNFAVSSGVFVNNSNLSDIDDALYFRKKLFIALKIPPGFLEQAIEAQTNRLSLTSLDMRFAKVIFRIQKAVAGSLRDVAIRHLTLLGVPQSEFKDLDIIMTPPSEWKEIAQAEVVQNRLNNAQSVKNLDVKISDSYIKSKFLKMTDEEIEKDEQVWRREQIERTELEGNKIIITGRYQAELDRGNAINQAAIAAAQVPEGQEGEEGSLNPEGDEGGEVPTEDELSAAAEEPNDPIDIEGGGGGDMMAGGGDSGTGSVEPFKPRPYDSMTAADIEADRGDRF